MRLTIQRVRGWNGRYNRMKSPNEMTLSELRSLFYSAGDDLGILRVVEQRALVNFDRLKTELDKREKEKIVEASRTVEKEKKQPKEHFSLD